MFFNKGLIKLKGVSMSEILIALAIIGVIAAITIPALSKAIPSKEETIHKKMSYIVEQVTGQLYDDDIMYPKKSDLFSQGFQNTVKVTINGVDYEGDTKFCELFASKFNKITSEVKCEEDQKSFTSTDNVDWYLPISDFKEGSAELMIDVNGSKGSNCEEGAANCKNPDRFKYYIKPNGTVTLKEPGDVMNDKFKIIVETTNPEGQSKLEISKLDNNGRPGAFETGDSHFRDLERNTRYILKATPKNGYFTEWQLNQRRVNIINSNVKVKLKYVPRSKYCIVLDVKNCDEPNLTQCATYKINTGCGYVETEPRLGEYKKDADGMFQYVGIGDEDGKYTYQCTGNSINMNNGRPVMNANGEPIKNDSGAVTSDSSVTSMFACDLLTGDYQIKVTPKSSYKIQPGGVFIQDVRLGTDTLYFSVELNQ